MQRRRRFGLRLAGLFLCVAVAVGLLYALSRPLPGLVPLGTLLDPAHGLYYTARIAEPPSEEVLYLPELSGEVTVVRDDQGVPHIFAATDLDAVTALGYVVAQDRLFQLDLQVRVASGRLSEVIGPEMLGADRFMRSLGMVRGAERNLERALEEEGIELMLGQAYARGINAYIYQLETRDLPFEIRLMGYEPQPFDLLSFYLINQYMTFDLTYPLEPAERYETVREALGDEVFEVLFPEHSRLYVPIIPEEEGIAHAEASPGFRRSAPERFDEARRILTTHLERGSDHAAPFIEGYVEGKGSNNWAVMGTNSETGAPIFAGDPHLRLSLPSIWYQVHLVTPSMNVYGVTIPGAILPILGFNDYIGWSSTNTGTDVIDHYALELDEQRTAYRFGEGYRDLELVLDTLYVDGQDPVIDTLYYSHWGPVLMDEASPGENSAVALQWTAHKENRSLDALWGMNRARSVEEFDEALRSWDTPMQNWLAADVHGNIGIRSAGYLPVRRGGHGVGLLDGSTDDFEWTGRVPFEELPNARNPEQGFLTSSNQQPTTASYPHYLGYNWRDSFRSLRLDSLLRGRSHSVDDFRRYQSDVVAMQRALFVPMIDTLSNLSPRADSLRRMLTAWDGETAVDRPEPLVLDQWLTVLEEMVWDHHAFRAGIRPQQTIMYYLLRGDLEGVSWDDLRERDDESQQTTAADVLRNSLEETADRLESDYGWDPEGWRWGDHQEVMLQHLTQSDALEPLARGPYPFPGYRGTVSPARGNPVVHSASWRSIYDFSEQPPIGYGVHPGGQSGNPFSRFYDHFLDTYLDFEYYTLFKPENLDEIPDDRVVSRMTLLPEP